MYVREIHIDTFRHIRGIHLGPFAHPPDHSELIVLAGPNSGGKSSVLELLGFALSNAWSLNWSLARSFPSNSFEVAIAITPHERDLVRQYLESHRGAHADDVIRYLDETGIYYRAFNYGRGEYSGNPTLHNAIHGLVTSALRNQYSRPLGFFLKSDRTYPAYGFQRDRIFAYSQIVQRDYIWSMAFNTSELQYRDIFEFLVQQRYHYFRRLGGYHHRLRTQPGAAGDPPSDPLEEYDQLLQRLFPGYRFADTGEDVPSNLFAQLPTGDVIPFSDLSSGEKEVFFILSAFLRHDVNNAVVVIDEPELHLHPELARLLIRTMQSIKPGNQIWLATHNTEIIDEAGRDRVIYMARDPQTYTAVVTLGTDETEASRRLKDFFGYSGYVGIARNLVFLEGFDASSDRKMFSNLFPEYGGKIKFVPAGSADNLTRINAAVLAILEGNLAWVSFYLIRDRDFLTPDIIRKYQEHASGRMYVLARHQIENYLLDDELVATVQADIFGRPATAERVRQQMWSIALRMSGSVLREMVSYRLNILFRPEDFSLGRILEGQPVLTDSGGWIEERLDAIHRNLAETVRAVRGGLFATTEPTELESLFREAQEELRGALFTSTDGWRLSLPGKRLLSEYARAEGLGNPIVLQNNLIKELSTRQERIPSELRQIMGVIAEGRTFTT